MPAKATVRIQLHPTALLFSSVPKDPSLPREVINGAKGLP